MVNIVGSGINVVILGIAAGAAYALGYTPEEKQNHAYKVLLGYFGALTVVATVPFFIVMKRRPGQQLPKGTHWALAGPN